MKLKPLAIIAALSLASLLATGTAQAQNFSQERFTALIQGTKTALQQIVAKNPTIFTMTSIQMADLLSASGIRDNAFAIEGMARVYSNYPNSDAKALVSDILPAAESLENLVGKYEEYANRTIPFPTQTQQAADDIAEQVFGAGGKTPSAFIDADGSSPQLDPLLARLTTVTWLPTAKDRSFVLKQMSKMLTDVAKEDFDMSKLEAGLHKLRRKLRYFPITATALGGLILTSDTGAYACNQTVNFPTKEGKFTLSPGTISETSCTVTKCLYDEVIGFENVLGDLKDSVEPIVIAAGNDVVPAATAAQATTDYNEFKASKVMENLAAEVNSCQ